MVHADEPTRDRQQVRHGGGRREGSSRLADGHGLGWYPKRYGGCQVGRLGLHAAIGAGGFADPPNKGSKVDAVRERPIYAWLRGPRDELERFLIPHSVGYNRHYG